MTDDIHSAVVVSACEWVSGLASLFEQLKGMQMKKVLSIVSTKKRAALIGAACATAIVLPLAAVGIANNSQPAASAAALVQANKAHAGVAPTGAAIKPAGKPAAAQGVVRYDSALGLWQREIKDPGRSVVLLGDSQAGGAAGIPPSQTWPTVGLSNLGYDVYNYSVGGTGYVASNLRGLSYANAIESNQFVLPCPSAAGPQPLVVLEGGGNDANTGASDQRIIAGVNQALDQVARLYPKSKVVMIGTLAHARQDGGGRRNQVDGIIAAVAKKRGVPYIATGDWITKYQVGSLMADRVHMRAEGHRILAPELTQALKALGINGPSA